MNFSKKVNDLKIRIINRILYSARGDFQLRLAATVIEYFLSFLPGIRKLLAISFHGWTVWIAYQHAGLDGGILTAIFPFVSEIYWLYFLFFESTFLFLAFLITFILVVSFIYISRKLTIVCSPLTYRSFKEFWHFKI